MSKKIIGMLFIAMLCGIFIGLFASACFFNLGFGFKDRLQLELNSKPISEQLESYNLDQQTLRSLQMMANHIQIMDREGKLSKEDIHNYKDNLQDIVDLDIFEKRFGIIFGDVYK